jgi:hypothetical protein
MTPATAAARPAGAASRAAGGPSVRAELGALARRAGAVVVLYAGIVAWLTWPLAAHLATSLPDTVIACRFDTLLSAWTLAYQSRALVTAPSTLPDANIYYPARHALFYGDPGFGALPYYLPIFLLTKNPALAINLTWLGCVVLTACALHLVVRRWTGSHLAGLVAASTFLTNRCVLWEWIPAQPYFSVLQYFPLIVFAAATPTRDARAALALLALVFVQCLTSVYVAGAVLLPLALLALVRLLRPPTRAAGARLALVVALAGLLLVPVLAGHVLVRAENPELARQTLWRGLAQPLTHLPWGPLSFLAPTAVPLVALPLIAAGILSLTTVGFRAGRLGLRSNAHQAGGEAGLRAAWRHAGFWAATGFLISLSPRIVLWRRFIRLPQFYLAHWLPVYEIIRTPVRLGVASLIGLCILAGLAFQECARWLPGDERRPWLRASLRGLAALLLVGTMYAQYSRGIATPRVIGRQPLPATYPVQTAIAPDSPLIRVLAAPGGPIVELPVATQGLYVWPFVHAPAMYRSIFHQRKILNGYSGYWPAGFPERMRLASALPDPAALAELRRETGLAMVLVHTERLDDDTRARWLDLAREGQRADLRLVARDGDDLLFAVGGAEP